MRRAPSAACPSPELIVQFARGELDEPQRTALEEHLACCSACGAALAIEANETHAEPSATPATTPSTPRRIPWPVEERILSRYQLLRRIGSGGLGEVYAARDPELDREVAIKLLHPRTHDGYELEAKARLVREAQAIAKVAHPNVVAVFDVGSYNERELSGQHDVGLDQDSVFIVMELVEGVTLREWLHERPRSWQEVPRVFQQAGRGLAAAHVAGVVHRDFKPANVMIARDGRARVLDFGLACSVAALEHHNRGIDHPKLPMSTLDSPLTREGTLMGTPAYMSPEQHAASAQPNERGDQYSFCVAFYEALAGRRPFSGKDLAELRAAIERGADESALVPRKVPRWLRRVVLRGLRVDREARWKSMDELLAALAQGQVHARIRRTVVMLGSFTVVCAAVFGGMQMDRRQRIATCESTGSQIEMQWPGRAAAVKAGILGTELTYAETTSNKLVPWLDEWTVKWRNVSTQTCIDATVEGTLTEQLRRRVDGCLDVQRAKLVSLLDQFIELDKQSVQRAVRAVTELPPPDECRDMFRLERSWPAEQHLEQVVELRERLADVASRDALGNYDEGVAQARAVLAEAQALGWPPLTAEAQFWLGVLRSRTGDAKGAVDILKDAYVAAASSGADLVAADAATRLAFVFAVSLAQHQTAMDWGVHAQVFVSRVREDAGVRGATLINVLGAANLGLGAYDQAERLFERTALILEEFLGAEHPEVANPIANLAIIHTTRGNHPQAQRFFERALAIREKALGPDHPLVAADLNNLAVVHINRGSYEEARRLLERAIDIRKDVLGSDHPDLAMSLANLASVHDVTGSYDVARELLARALAMFERSQGIQHPNVARTLSALADIELELGAFHQAEDLYRQRHGCRRVTRDRGRNRPSERVVACAYTAGSFGACWVLLLHAPNEISRCRYRCRRFRWNTAEKNARGARPAPWRSVRLAA